MPQDRATVNSEGVDEGGAGPIEVFEPLVARPYGASSERWVSRHDPRWRDERFPSRNRHNQPRRVCEAVRQRRFRPGEPFEMAPQIGKSLLKHRGAHAASVGDLAVIA